MCFLETNIFVSPLGECGPNCRQGLEGSVATRTDGHTDRCVWIYDGAADQHRLARGALCPGRAQTAEVPGAGSRSTLSPSPRTSWRPRPPSLVVTGGHHTRPGQLLQQPRGLFTRERETKEGQTNGQLSDSSSHSYCSSTTTNSSRKTDPLLDLFEPSSGSPEEPASCPWPSEDATLEADPQPQSSPQMTAALADTLTAAP
nr:uncharacterized protein LOC105882604 [Microcebus murinus]